MKNVKIETNIQQVSFNELTVEDQELMTCAKDATQRSYSPYSHFAVGAALRLKSGKIVLGANQENAVFPVGLCAERTAIFAAQVSDPDQPIMTLAIAAKNPQGDFTTDPVTPCGSCRQVILEMESRYNQNVRILLYGQKGIYIIDSVKDLMPLSFAEENMERA